MEFAQKFIALREALRAQCPAEFSHENNAVLCGRTVALHSFARVTIKQKILGLMETKNLIYSTERRVYALEPNPLTENTIQDWWSYGCRIVDELSQPEAGHQFSMVSLMLACPQVDARVARKIRRLRHEVEYNQTKLGWVSLRFAVIELTTGRIYTNSMGSPLANILKSAWKA